MIVRSSTAFLLIGAAIVLGVGLFTQLPGRSKATAPEAASRVVKSVPPDTGRISISAEDMRAAYRSRAIAHPIKSLLNVPSSLAYGDFVWNDRGAGAGNVWIRIDLTAQILSVFRGGDEIGTAVILYGADRVPTPTGKFPIRAKFKDHRSSTYDGAPMPYTLQLTPDGVSIHGSNVRSGFATHGCIGVPGPFAAKLFDVASMGDEVMIVRGSDNSLSHA